LARLNLCDDSIIGRWLTSVHSIGAHRVDKLGGLCLLLDLCLHGFLVLLNLEFAHSVEKLHDTPGCDDLELSFMFLILTCRNVTAHQSDFLFFKTLLSELGFFPLLLGDFLRGTLVLCENGLLHLVFVNLFVNNRLESGGKRAFQDFFLFLIGTARPIIPVLIEICSHVIMLLNGPLCLNVISIAINTVLTFSYTSTIRGAFLTYIRTFWPSSLKVLSQCFS
jgi:hypothetical protein